MFIYLQSLTNYIQQKTLYSFQVRHRAARNLGMCIVIPAYYEPFLLRLLMNLEKCDLPNCAIEVLVIINNGEHASDSLIEKNRKIYLQALDWSKKNVNPLLRFHILYYDNLPKPFANADLARKIGMDEALFRLEKAKKGNGIIAVLDADTRVQKNYFTALEAHFRRRSVPKVCVTDFEFPRQGIDFEDAIYEAAQQYELNLHYLRHAYNKAKMAFDYSIFPSSFAVDAKTYQTLGGWSSAIGKSDLLKEVHFLKTSKVIASPRLSKRANSQAGSSISSIIKNKGVLLTYHPTAFEMLNTFISKNESRKELSLKSLNDVPPCILDYFNSIDFEDCALNEETFAAFFSNYHLQSYLDFAHQKHYQKVPVTEAAQAFLNVANSLSIEELIKLLKNFV